MKHFKNGKQKHLLWLVFTVSLLFSAGAHAQTVTEEFKNAPLKAVLKEVERQTKMSVIYKVDEVDENKTVTATFAQTPVREVLSKVLGSGLSFEIENKIITIHKQRPPQGKTVQAGDTKGQPRKITGKVTDEKGEPLIGVSVKIKNTGLGVVTNLDGEYTLTTSEANPTLEFSYIGYTPQALAVGSKSYMDVKLKEESSMLKEVVVTAMGIQRKESSLTYATQRVKAEDLMRVQDPNVANSLEGKVSGVTITPNAGGAGGASKILLRGNKSIMGNNAPLIVIDGVPMANNIRNQTTSEGNLLYAATSEGSDPLSLINPDDIESMNILKGANAAALYGSAAANGVVMITTKKGREGKIDITVNSNITFDTPLLTPEIQNVYGGPISTTGRFENSGWGDKVADRAADALVIDAPLDDTFYGGTHKVYLRNHATDDTKEFFRTGVTANNSLSISGGTEKVRTYFSIANSHANGMIKHNSYNRNTVNFRQNYKMFDRLNVDVSLNYAQTITRNRPGGGRALNPLYNLYMMPRNVDLAYYRDNYYVEDGKWKSMLRGRYVRENGQIQYLPGQADLKGVRQQWPFLSNMNNNPYWLTGMNKKVQKEDRVYGTLSAVLDIYDGLTLQARVNYDHLRFHGNMYEYATTFLPSNISDYGRYGDYDNKTTELYTDYLLSYNKEFGDYSVSATAGWVGHTSKYESKDTYADATSYDNMLAKLPERINFFDTRAGGMECTKQSKESNWDKAYLFTAQLGWKEIIYVDGSYRRDWYRPFRYFKQKGKIDVDNYGYFGLGANAIISSLAKLPEWFNYLKYRVSYSEVGNSIPNKAYEKMTENLQTGAAGGNDYTDFYPVPEKTQSFETGVEMLFLNNRLSVDFTFYSAKMKNLYMEVPSGSGSTELLNSASVRNRGFEATVGYNFRLAKDMNWRTSYNLSYNDNTILQTAFDENGKERKVEKIVDGVKVAYRVGGSIGDMYVNDFMRDENGHIALTNSGRPKINKSSEIYAGNMNSKWQMGWSNTFNYKDFTLSFLINGRIGGKVVSLTEGDLDANGLSQRTADARLYAEQHNIVAADYGNVPGIVLPDGSGRIVPITEYFNALGASTNPKDYIYSATNFRLRELSAGYTFRDLLGANKHLSVSFIARNLFFLYNDSPADPDVSLATGNGLSGFELFNMPSSRSYGFSLKLNF